MEGAVRVSDTFLNYIYRGDINWMTNEAKASHWADFKKFTFAFTPDAYDKLRLNLRRAFALGDGYRDLPIITTCMSLATLACFCNGFTPGHWSLRRGFFKSQSAQLNTARLILGKGRERRWLGKIARCTDEHSQELVSAANLCQQWLSRLTSVDIRSRRDQTQYAHSLSVSVLCGYQIHHVTQYFDRPELTLEHHSADDYKSELLLMQMANQMCPCAVVKYLWDNMVSITKERDSLNEMGQPS